MIFATIYDQRGTAEVGNNKLSISAHIYVLFTYSLSLSPSLSLSVSFDHFHLPSVFIYSIFPLGQETVCLLKTNVSLQPFLSVTGHGAASMRRRQLPQVE